MWKEYLVPEIRVPPKICLSTALLFNFVKMMTISAESVAKAYEKVPILNLVPLSHFQVLHGLLREEVK